MTPVRAAGLALIAVLSAAGCGSGETVVFLPRPEPVPGAETVVVLVQDADRAVVRLDRVDATAFELPIDHWAGAAPDDAMVVVAFFTATLEQMGRTSGPLDPEAAAPCALAEPMTAVEARLTRGRAEPWRTTSEARTRLQATLFPGGTAACVRPDRCDVFAVEVTTLPIRAAVEALAVVDDETVLAGGTNGDYFLVSRAGDADPQPQLRGFPARTLARDAQGRFWFGGGRGRVLRGPLEGPFEHIDLPLGTVTWVAPHPTTDRVVALRARTSTTGPDTLFLHEWRADGWHTLAQEEVAEIGLSKLRAAWVSDDELLVTYGGPSVFHLEGDVWRSHIIGFANPLFDLEINAVTAMTDGSAVIAGSDGRVYGAPPPYDSWLAISDAVLAVQAEVVAPTETGFLYGGADGLVGQYVRGSTPCRVQHLTASDAELIVPVGGAYAVSGGVFGDANMSSVTWLEAVDGR